MWALDDRVEKVVDVLLAGKFKLNIEVGRTPVPPLRDDAVQDCSCPVLIIDPR
jgi:hypothetical protein